MLGVASLYRARPAVAADCGAAPPVAEPTEDARKAYQAAIELVEAGRFAEGLAGFQRAYDLSPSYVILYNIGKAAALSGDPARALAAYRCHLAHGGAAVDPKQHSEVSAEIDRLRSEVGLLVVEVDQPGAKIEVDGAPAGMSPLEAPIEVNPGKRLVRVRGARVESRAVDVLRGGRLVTKFQVGVPEEPKGQAFRFPSSAVGVSWVVAGLLGVSTAVTGTLALVGSKDIEDDTYLGPGQLPTQGSDLDDKVERTRALATATDVLLTGFLITGAAAVSFSIVNTVNKESAPAVKVEATLGPLGLGVRGAFP